MTLPKTAHVRVCIAIAEDGKWACGGWCMGESAQSDADLRDCAVSGLDEEEGHYAVHWLEAEVPVPQRPAEMTIPALVHSEAPEGDFEDEVVPLPPRPEVSADGIILSGACPLCHATAGFAHKMSCTYSTGKGLRFYATERETR